jgi:hypothetical protein
MNELLVFIIGFFTGAMATIGLIIYILAKKVANFFYKLRLFLKGGYN